MKIGRKLSTGMLLCLIVFFVGVSGLQAQGKGVLRGNVQDAETNLALPGAVVTINENQAGTVTSERGEFTMLDVPTGEYNVKVTYVGYQSFEGKVKIESGKTTELIVKLEPGSVLKGEVVVIGEQLKGQAKALNTERTNPNITNVISSDQVGRFPDANVGDALKRVPGITVQYDQGEARFGLVRGTAARLNSVAINGDRIPSAEAENREVQLDLIPADMIQTIEVNKALTPSMDADAIGGSINLITRAVPNDLRLSVTGGSGINFLSEKPIWTGSIIAGNRFLDNKIGVIVSASLHDHYLGSDNVEAEWFEEDGNVYLKEHQIRRYDVQRLRQSISAGLDFKLADNHTVFFNTIYNDRKDWENRYRLVIKTEDSEEGGIPNGEGLLTEVEAEKQTKGGIDDDTNKKTRLEHQKTFNLSLGGEHIFADILKMTWKGNYAFASEERPHERYANWENKLTIRTDITDPEKPFAEIVDAAQNADANWELDKFEEEHQFTEDIDMNGRIDFELPILTKDDKSYLKFGGRYRGKDKKRDNSLYSYELLDGVTDYENMSTLAVFDATDTDFLAGNYQVGNQTTNVALGQIDLENSNIFEKKDEIEDYVPGNFDAKETIIGGYVQYDQWIGKKLFLLGGVRFENTSVDYNANRYDTETEEITPTNGTKDYMNILPGLHVKYYLEPLWTVRLAWTNTLSRPNYYSLAPYYLINPDDREIEEGNSELEATTSMNFDLMTDYYFESIGLLSLGVFYKNLDDFIYVHSENQDIDGEEYDYAQWRNGEKAQVMGFEVAAQRQLDFLPSFLKNIGIYLNYTYTNSSIDGLEFSERDSEDLSLPGTAENMFNGSIAYEDDLLAIRVSLNYTTDYIDELDSKDAFEDRYYDTQMFLDVNGTVKITPCLRFFVEANNLTNQPLRYYQGIQDRTMQMEYYAARVTAGIKYDL